MHIQKTVYVDERDIRKAIADYVAAQNAGDGPVVNPNDIEFQHLDSNGVSASVVEG